MRRLLCAVLLVFAGCLGPGAGPVGTESPTDAPTPTPTASPTPVESPTPTTSPPPATTAEPGPTDANTVAYDALSPDARDAFDAAREGEARFLPDSPYVDGEFHDPDALGQFRDHGYVETNGTVYELSLHQGALYASYSIHADRESPGENASVVAFDDLDANVSAQVRSAVENGSHHVPLGKWDSLHPALRDVEYVRYEGESYRLSYAVGDYWVTVMEARPG